MIDGNANWKIIEANEFVTVFMFSQDNTLTCML